MRPAVVTGASSGIGRETALELSKNGFSVLLAGRRREALEEAAAECGEAAAVFVGDLTQAPTCSELMIKARTIRAEGLPLIVNAAGIAWFGPTQEMSSVTLDELIRINLIAAIEVCRNAVPWLLEKGGGDIVNVGSIASIQPFPQAAAYVASKAGLLAFTRSLNTEVRSKGIRVTAVLPGSTDTPLWDQQSFSPERGDMISSRAVAEAIVGAATAPRDRSFDEILLMPPKGIL